MIIGGSFFSNTVIMQSRNFAEFKNEFVVVILHCTLKFLAFLSKNAKKIMHDN